MGTAAKVCAGVVILGCAAWWISSLFEDGAESTAREAGGRGDGALAHPEAGTVGEGSAAPVDPDRGVDLPGIEAETAPARVAIDPLVERGITAFRVLGSAGEPVVDAQVLVLRGEELLLDERTDDAGQVEIAADEEAAALVVAAPNRSLEWHDVVLVAGRQDIHLSIGARLSGRLVTEDGDSPGVMSFRFISDQSPGAFPILPAVVTEALTVPTLHSYYEVVETDEEGLFDFRGLPESWSGSLLVEHEWKVVSTTHGQVPAPANSVRFAEPATDVVVCVAQRPLLFGRLVLRDDGSPVGDAPLVVMLDSLNTPRPTWRNATTDEAGRFEILIPLERLDEVELRLGHRFHECPSILRLEKAELPDDGDLGDVVVENVRHVSFRMQDAEEEPIPGGVAVAAGVQSEPTGEDGRGELRWIARAADRLVAEARGFVPTEARIPSVVVEPLVVTMGRANELVVKLHLPEGAKPSQFKVVLHGEEQITAGPAGGLPDRRRHVSEAWYPPDIFGWDLAAHLCARPDAQTGTVAFYALRPGIELTLEVHGMSGIVVYHSERVPPLAPAEHREIEVQLETGLITFRGHVLDMDGNPLERASLNLGFEELGYTNAEGAFECFLAESRPGILLVSHVRYTTLYLADYAVPTDGQPVEFRLKPARPLTIEVVDENGTPLPGAELSLLYGEVAFFVGEIEGNRRVVPAMPDGPFEIRAILAGRGFEQPHDPAISEATVVLPVPGSAFTVLDGAITAGRTGRFGLVLRAPGLEPFHPLVEILPAAPGLRLEIPIVFPGTYQAELNYIPSNEEKAAGQERVRSEPVTIEVESGRETEVRLTLPADGD